MLLYMMLPICGHMCVVCLQVLADIEAKFRVTMAASNGRLEDAMEAVTLHDGRRRPGRRSNYEILLKVCPSAQLPSSLFIPRT